MSARNVHVHNGPNLVSAVQPRALHDVGQLRLNSDAVRWRRLLPAGGRCNQRSHSFWVRVVCRCVPRWVGVPGGRRVAHAVRRWAVQYRGRGLLGVRCWVVPGTRQHEYVEHAVRVRVRVRVDGDPDNDAGTLPGGRDLRRRRRRRVDGRGRVRGGQCVRRRKHGRDDMRVRGQWHHRPTRAQLWPGGDDLDGVLARPRRVDECVYGLRGGVVGQFPVLVSDVYDGHVRRGESSRRDLCHGLFMERLCGLAYYARQRKDALYIHDAHRKLADPSIYGRVLHSHAELHGFLCFGCNVVQGSRNLN